MVAFFKESWAFSLENWQKYLPLTLLYIVVLAVPELYKHLFASTSEILVLVFGFLSGVVMILADFALIDFTLALSKKKQEPKFKQLFDYINYLLPLLALGLVVGIFAMGVTLALLRFASYFLPLFGAVFLFFWVRFFYWRIIIVEERCGVIASLRRSWQRTEGQFWTTALLVLVTNLVELLGFVLLLFGAIFTLPLSNRILVFGYRAAYPSGISGVNAVE